MKLKSMPADFRVEERLDFAPSKGNFALYRLDKCGLGTPEAIQAILHKWQLARRDVGYAGMKDRHADTTQYITIYRGPKSSLTDKSFSLEYLGQCPRAVHAKDILSNRFSIRLRRIALDQQESLNARCVALQQSGVANYFDDQRFGSIGFSGELIAVPWCLGNYERALYLALAEPNSHDRPREREQKQILRDLWGQWPACKDRLDRSHRRSIVTYLCDHPVDFKRALANVRQDLRSIYIACFQSWVWNRWLSRLIELNTDDGERAVVASQSGELATALNANAVEIGSTPLLQLELPLPSARQHSWPAGTLELLEEVLKPLELDVRQMRLKYPRDTFFSRGNRTAWLKPKSFLFRWEEDSLHPNFRSLCLDFELPRGAYATMLIRSLSNELQTLEEEMESEEDASPAVDSV
jgi:tRNA pseudouridine13 synthase